MTTVARRLSEPGLIVIADDDPDDQALARDALTDGGWQSGISQVYDGEELLALLRRPALAPGSRPALVLLDLNMPRKNGFEALQAIRRDSGLKDTPVVVFSTSRAEEDVARSYLLGCNSYVTKPSGIRAMEELMRDLLRYWFEISELPHGAHES